MASAIDLYTTVKNVSGGSRYFGYVSPRGKVMASTATYSFAGTFQEQPGWNPRKQAALESDLLNNRLEILQLPRPIVRDTTTLAVVAAPTGAATVGATGGGSSGGLLEAGVYKANFTLLNNAGETTIGTTLSGAATVAAGNIPRVTFPSASYNRNLYITNNAADSTTLRLYAENIPAGTVTYDLGVALPTIGLTAPQPPTVNTTASPGVKGLDVGGTTFGVVPPSWGAYAG